MMFEIKYTIKKFPVLESWFFADYEFKTVSKRELKKYVEDGWEIENKEYKIISDLKMFWNTYDRDKKTDIILVFVGAFLGYLLSKI
ncbi:hypothetical protein [Chryseobacterium sp.]|uniref:hypothetical protein n=1 Tax=Chryseobacterium sp. TaxID=1871047 RepID=UPI0012A7BE67|nr:hypothetical protein [Chryseobacterium sp.]QFG53925.1 hypothetical protein F7R58_10310 [Chryseobacterium sp.]